MERWSKIDTRFRVDFIPIMSIYSVYIFLMCLAQPDQSGLQGLLLVPEANPASAYGTKTIMPK